MLFFRFGALGAALLPLSNAGLVALEASLAQLATRDLIISEQHLQRRLSTDFSLDQTLVDEVLFDGTSDAFGLLPISVPPVTIKCVKCCTKGAISASLTDEQIVNPILRFDMKGVEAFVQLDVVANGASSFTLPLFKVPPGPLGIDIPGGPSLGLTFEINLLFNIAANLDLTGGFFLKLPDDAFFEASVFNGTLSNISLDGIMSKSLPMTVNNNGTTSTFQVDLQLKAQIGIDTSSSLLDDIPNFGVGAAVGVFVNLIEFTAQLDSTPECQLQSTETFDVNVGAFLQANVDVGQKSKSLGAVPTVSTTLFEAALGTQCLVSAGVAFPTRSSSVATALSCIVTSTALSTDQSSLGTKTGSSTYTRWQSTTHTSITPSPSPSGYERRSPSNTTTTVANVSTVFSTTTLTITSCGAAIVNCPGSLQRIIEVPMTLCASSSSPAVSDACSVVTDAVTLTSLSTPVLGTLTSYGSNRTTTTTVTFTRNNTAMYTPPPMTTADIGGLLRMNSSTTSFAVATGSVPTQSPGTFVTVSSGDRALEHVGSICAAVGAGLAAVAVVFL